MSLARRPRVLVSLLSDKPTDLHLARRLVAHDRLLLVVHPGAKEAAKAVHATEARLGTAASLDLHHTEARDVEGLMAELGAMFTRLRDCDIVLNAAGGDPAVLTAALFAAYANGIETWFYQEGRADRFPVLHGLRLEHRVGEAEARILLAVPEAGVTSRVLAERLLVPRERIENALRALRKKDLVLLEAREGIAWAQVTTTGRSVREHLEAHRRPARGR